MADARLADDDVAHRLGGLPTWTLVDGKLHRELVFADFRVAFSFMTAVALDAEKLDHHPDWSNVWNKVVIDVASHSAGGITERCFTLAERVEEHARRMGVGGAGA
jgi:4a-hydroxytetrahydrobiopterin dehydratase